MTETNYRFASYGERLLIELIDTLIVSAILYLTLFQGKNPHQSLYGFFVWWYPISPDPQRWQKFLIDAAYTLPFWSFLSTSPGNKILGFKIITETGAPLNFSVALIRYFSYWLSVLPLGLGFIWILRDPKRQAWHDKIARTYVIKGLQKEFPCKKV